MMFKHTGDKKMTKTRYLDHWTSHIKQLVRLESDLSFSADSVRQILGKEVGTLKLRLLEIVKEAADSDSTLTD